MQLTEQQQRQIKTYRLKTKIDKIMKLNEDDSFKMFLIDITIEEARLKQRQWNNKYLEEHRDERNEYAKKYYEEHRDEELERSKKYYEEHKDERNDYFKKYNEDNRPRRKVIYESNKDIALAMLGGKCYLTDISAVDEPLEFAHVVAGSKEKRVTQYFLYNDMTTRQDFLAEIGRCVLMTKHAHIDYDYTWFKLHNYPQTEESFPYFVRSYKAFWASTYKSYNQYLTDYPVEELLDQTNQQETDK